MIGQEPVTSLRTDLPLGVGAAALTRTVRPNSNSGLERDQVVHRAERRRMGEPSCARWQVNPSKHQRSRGDLSPAVWDGL
jgi:hypothetical protein